LARQIAVSFENEIIRIVYASLKRGNLTVKKTLVLKDEEFDDFLKKEKTRHFIVVCDFKTFYQDILLLPPVKEKFLRNIVEAEIRKRSPEMKEFSFFHVSLGERMHEGRKMNETFVFAVNNYDLSNVIERFGRYGKVVKGIYPAAFTISRLVNLSYGIAADPLLCVAESESRKILLLIKDGKLYFIRAAQSFESGIHDIDVQNINMTVNYCRQTVRLNPLQVILLGTACSHYETTIDLTLPVICMNPPSAVAASRETIMEFIIPLSVILNVKGLETGNLLPPAYRTLYRQKEILTYYTAFFVIFFIIGLGYLKIKQTETEGVRKKIDSLRSEMQAMEPAIADYENKKKELDKRMPLINFINSMNSSPDMQMALAALSSLKEAREKGVNIDAIDMSPEGNAVRIKIKGGITAKSFTEMQQLYQGITGSIKKTGGMELLSDKIDLSGKVFHIEIKYSGVADAASRP